MSSQDWPERMHAQFNGHVWVHEPFVLALERRYAILRQAIVERSQAPARGINCIELLAQCPPLPKETT